MKAKNCSVVILIRTLDRGAIIRNILIIAEDEGRLNF